MCKVYDLFGCKYLIDEDGFVAAQSYNDPKHWVHINLCIENIATIVDCGVLIAKNIKLK